ILSHAVVCSLQRSSNLIRCDINARLVFSLQSTSF
ncbi:hypothetical protein X975_11018, partial [Stegodyphus mimosarum]